MNRYGYGHRTGMNSTGAPVSLPPGSETKRGGATLFDLIGGRTVPGHQPLTNRSRPTQSTTTTADMRSAKATGARMGVPCDTHPPRPAHFVASIANIHDMAEATHAANGIAAWIVSIAIGGTLSVLAYVASITDGRTHDRRRLCPHSPPSVSTAPGVALPVAQHSLPSPGVRRRRSVLRGQHRRSQTARCAASAPPVSQPVAPAATPAGTAQAVPACRRNLLIPPPACGHVRRHGHLPG